MHGATRAQFPLVGAHQTLPCIYASLGIGSLGSGMAAQVLLLILSQICFGPIRVLNVLDALEQGGSRDIHFSENGVLSVGLYVRCSD